MVKRDERRANPFREKKRFDATAFLAGADADKARIAAEEGDEDEEAQDERKRKTRAAADDDDYEEDEHTDADGLPEPPSRLYMKEEGKVPFTSEAVQWCLDCWRHSLVQNGGRDGLVIAEVGRRVCKVSRCRKKRLQHVF